MLPVTSKNFDKITIDFLLRHAINKVDVLVYTKCDIRTSFERLRNRNNQKTRFDFWDDDKCLLNLKIMNGIFELVIDNSFCNVNIFINAQDDVVNKAEIVLQNLATELAS